MFWYLIQNFVNEKKTKQGFTLEPKIHRPKLIESIDQIPMEHYYDIFDSFLPHLCVCTVLVQMVWYELIFINYHRIMSSYVP